MVELERRDLIHKLFDAGVTSGSEIHQRTAIPRSTVFRILAKFRQGGDIQRKSGTEKQRILHVNDARSLVSLVNQNRKMSIRKLASRFIIFIRKVYPMRRSGRNYRGEGTPTRL
ncbi:hypothetical protein LOD99_10290 [Oopsacas minuta]|uniref:Paired domain-containing protein n=1 Tax=Oopsacas minuta TaxID=111878 RepID=A0AAV7KKE1_9METZ|nr:hypothetical protein LOD99_10290 [Oopsacas minuta]